VLKDHQSWHSVCQFAQTLSSIFPPSFPLLSFAIEQINWAKRSLTCVPSTRVNLKMWPWMARTIETQVVGCDLHGVCCSVYLSRIRLFEGLFSWANTLCFLDFKQKQVLKKETYTLLCKSFPSQWQQCIMHRSTKTGVHCRTTRFNNRLRSHKVWLIYERLTLAC
jgi:hypothetical protein